MARLLRIRDWNVHFENSRTRQLKKLGWIPIPNDLSSYGLRQIANSENSAAIFGAFVLMLELASHCDPRGDLVRGNGEHYDAESLAHKTGFPQEAFESAIVVCSRIGWIQVVDGDGICHHPAQSGQVRPDVATSDQKRPLKGREGKGKERKTTTAPPKQPGGGSESRAITKIAESIYDAFPRRVARRTAIEAIRKAIRRLQGNHGDNAGEWLLAQTVKYAAARKNAAPKYTPHPSTWFNGARYSDDPATWPDPSDAVPFDTSWANGLSPEEREADDGA